MSELTFHELLKAGLIDKPKKVNPIDDYVEIQEPAEKPLIEKRGSKESLTAIVKKNRMRRKIMNERLMSWGEWSQGARGGRSIDPGTTYAAQDGIGYDHALLSDFDSLMIKIEGLVMDLNRKDRDLIIFEYQIIDPERVRKWSERYKVVHSRYLKRKSELLLYLSLKC